MSLILPRAGPDLSAPIVFLDIDGVLNHMNVFDKRERFINPENMNALNMLLDETKANLVISSAWRYLICDKLMTLEGFHHMLTTHGLAYERHVIGKTMPDKAGYDCRARQILAWLHCNFREMGGGDNPVWIALDDTRMDDMISDHAVYTTSHEGLRSKQVTEAIGKIRWQQNRLKSSDKQEN